MSLSYSEKQDLFREMRRDAAERYRLQAGCARMGVLDAVENDEPLREFAIKMLKKLGQKIPDDPVTALTYLIEGRDSAVRDSGGLGTVGGMGMVRGSGMDGRYDRSALDANDGSPDFMERHLKGKGYLKGKV